MGRAGISYTEVAKACEQIVAKGEQVSIDRIREITGTGNRSTLSKLRKQWEAFNQGGTAPEGELLLENEEED